MDISWMERTALLVGEKGLEKLNNAHVLIVGLGGVGSYAAEAIGRSGVGKMTIIDGDTVDPTNRNRQLQALSSTHGQNKARLMGERLKLINPEVEIDVHFATTPIIVPLGAPPAKFPWAINCPPIASPNPPGLVCSQYP